MPHILDFGSKFKIEGIQEKHIPCQFIINRPVILDFGSEFEINQDLECEDPIEEE